jgi:hypothetical protein
MISLGGRMMGSSFIYIVVKDGKSRVGGKERWLNKRVSFLHLHTHEWSID